MDKLTDAFLEQLIDKESFERRKTTLLAERRLTQDRLNEMQRNPSLATDRLQVFLERAGSAYLTYRLGTIDEKRELINMLTSNRTVEGKSVKIMLDSPFDIVANRFNVSGGGPPRVTPLIWDRLIHTLLKVLGRADKPSLAGTTRDVETH